MPHITGHKIHVSGLGSAPQDKTGSSCPFALAAPGPPVVGVPVTLILPDAPSATEFDFSVQPVPPATFSI